MVSSDTTHNRVALVEDHARLADLVLRGLSKQGVVADLYQALGPAIVGVLKHPYSVVIVDRGLPDGDGLDLVRKLRAAGRQTPCLVLTARDALRDRVEGLDAGADDYLAKPFALEELSARVRALMRRSPQLREETCTFGDLAVSPESSSMSRGGEAVSLSGTELQILIALIRAGERTVRREVLELAAWGLGESVTPNALDVAVHRLRKKMGALRSQVSLINKRNQGFVLSCTRASA